MQKTHYTNDSYRNDMQNFEMTSQNFGYFNLKQIC